MMDTKLENILKEVRLIFMKYGIRNYSMDDICRNIGISKKTLYNYVDNKTDLLQKVLDYEFIMDNGPLGVYLIKGNAIDILLDVSMRINKEFETFNPIYIFELNKYYPKIFKEFVEKKRKVAYEKIYKNLEQGIKEGIYRKDLDIELVTILYIRKIEDIHNPDLIESGNFSFKEIFSAMFENHIRGISNEKGIAYFENQKKSLNIL
ncbi:MAG: TetR/AcrR family transcriptional regulator [Bacteroidales bacterium]|nr:TetR/AcrR family transcriptional regulator [Bacteroidales bacterium]